MGALLGCLLAAGAWSEEDPRDRAEVHRLGELEIIDPWAKGAIGIHELKVFFEFRNHGEADKLVAVESPASIGPTLFRVFQTGKDVQRIANAESIAIPGGGASFELSEVGHYIELTQLQVPAVMGKVIPVTLHFERAGKIDLNLTCRFHSPKLGRRIRAAARAGDTEALKALREEAEAAGER